MSDLDQTNCAVEDLHKNNLELIRIIGGCKQELFHPQSKFTYIYREYHIDIVVVSPSGFTLHFKVSAENSTWGVMYHVSRTDPNGEEETFSKLHKDIRYSYAYLDQLIRLRDQHISNADRGYDW